jgi:hypothetical protein
MDILRVFARVLASNGFRLCILGLAVISTLLAVFGSAAAVKGSLDKSGVYDKLPDMLLSEASNQQAGNIDAQAALKRPEVIAAAKSVFNATYLRSTANNVIDGTYHWLDGTSKEPDFTINLQPAINDFKNQVADAGVNRLKSLPPCTAAQLQGMNMADSGDINLFTTACLPPGTNLETVRQQAIDHIFGGSKSADTSGDSGPFGNGKDQTFSTASLPKDDQGRTVFGKAKFAPQAYQELHLGPWVLAGLAALCGAAVVFLFPTRRRGLRSLARSLVGIGILLTAISILANFLFTKLVNSPSVSHSASAPTPLILDVVHVFEASLSRHLLWFGAAFLSVGVISLIALRMTQPKPAESVSAGGNDAVEDKPHRAENPPKKVVTAPSLAPLKGKLSAVPVAEHTPDKTIARKND